MKCRLRCRLGLLREGYGVLSGVPDPPLKGTIFVGQHLSAIVKCREYAASAVHKQNRGSRCRLVCGLEWAQARMHYMGVHTVATWRIRLSDPCAAMRLCVRLLYLFILFIWTSAAKGASHLYAVKNTRTHIRLTAICPGLPGWAGTRKVKPIWILLKQETVSGSGISWAICKSAPRSRQITTPAPHHSVFYRPDALPAAQPTASKHWRTYMPVKASTVMHVKQWYEIKQCDKR